MYYVKLINLLLRGPLLTIHKSFIRPHPDYDDVIYDQYYNKIMVSTKNWSQCNIMLLYLQQAL